MDESKRIEAMMEVHELMRLNQARVLAGEGSPKILVGGINLTDGLNFHTLEMVRMGASMVSIALQPEHFYRPDRLYCAPNELIQSVMDRLPSKWKPDFFWDSQAEQGHYFPCGLGELDIPKIVSFNHAHLGHSLLHMRGMFDCVIAPSKNMLHFGDAYLPFGASWGTMDGRIDMFGKRYAGEEKTIDVSCAIGTSIGRESVRHTVLSEMKLLKGRRTDLNVVIASGLAQDAYFDLLAKSKVAINVGAWGCSMTYRPFEVIAQESALVHVDETGYGSSGSLSEFFQDGDYGWYVSSRPDGLEAAIQKALEHPFYKARDVKIAAEINYSYRKQYERLFELAGSVKRKKTLNTTDWSRHAFAVNWTTGYKDYAKVHEWALTDADRLSANGGGWNGDLSLWSPEDLEVRWKWQTDLALGKDPKEVYEHYSHEAHTQEAPSCTP